MWITSSAMPNPSQVELSQILLMAPTLGKDLSKSRDSSGEVKGTLFGGLGITTCYDVDESMAIVESIAQAVHMGWTKIWILTDSGSSTSVSRESGPLEMQISMGSGEKQSPMATNHYNMARSQFLGQSVRKEGRNAAKRSQAMVESQG
ncbi:hypothetical protein IFM89_018733 [Coptis chinensis]|uniref:Uncharacterized protein n=1 Tax=Coptis chinensis TaxID=261450 RepID=A0A835M8E6_9MAGN|nr:hypothetical protein IFM89_018733 [Coptis chinensis]